MLLSVATMVLVSFQVSAWVPGNYGRSCRACSFNRRVLRCLCRTREGWRRWTRLYVSRRCQYVRNINGRLRCTRMRPRPVPAHVVPSILRYKLFIVNFHGPAGWNRSSFYRQCRRACRLIDRNWSGVSRAVRSSHRRVNCYCH